MLNGTWWSQIQMIQELIGRNTKVLESGYVEAQYRVYYPENPTNLIPAILLDNSYGNIIFEGKNNIQRLIIVL